MPLDIGSPGSNMKEVGEKYQSFYRQTIKVRQKADRKKCQVCTTKQTLLLLWSFYHLIHFTWVSLCSLLSNVLYVHLQAYFPFNTEKMGTEGKRVSEHTQPPLALHPGRQREETNLSKTNGNRWEIEGQNGRSKCRRRENGGIIHMNWE